MNAEKTTEKNNGNKASTGGKNEMQAKVGEWKDTATSTLNEWKETAGDMLEDTKETASDLFHKAEAYGEEAVAQTREAIRKYPAPILLAGVGVGFLAGYLIGRK